jgi:DNA-binding transcriptional ArsR family regulator
MSLEEEERRIAGLRARAHPLRLKMLSLLTGLPMSAAELGRELGISQALASYHLRQLADAGVVELAEERMRRGGRERRYRVTGIDREWRKPVRDDEGEALMLEALIDQLRDRRARTDWEATSLTVDAELWVSEEDWVQARVAIAEAGLRLHERARPPREPGTVCVATTIMMFLLQDGRPAGPEPS